jgi:hypothetical protein
MHLIWQKKVRIGTMLGGQHLPAIEQSWLVARLCLHAILIGAIICHHDTTPKSCQKKFQRRSLNSFIR